MKDIVDALVATIAAWLTMVVTLEVNDFRRRLMAAYEDSYSLAKDARCRKISAETENTSRRYMARRYMAAMMAIKLGMYDAIIDWGLTYTVCYAIVGGITWYNADKNLEAVIWGLSLMGSAVILAVAGLKIPAWLGFCRKSQIKTIRDTSGYAALAVSDLTTKEESTITAFRYQVRLGVGKHFSQFVWILLPFYVSLLFWFYLLSIFIGVVIGHFFLYVVFNCRKRFRNHRGRVVIGASALALICSAFCFMDGVWIVNVTWGHEYGNNKIVVTISFFVWLALCGLFTGVKYYEHRKFSTQVRQSVLFDWAVCEELRDFDNDVEGESKGPTVEGVGPQDAGADVEGKLKGPTVRFVEAVEDPVEIPLESNTACKIIRKEDRRQVMQKDNAFYQTAYFATKFNWESTLVMSASAPTASSGNNDDASEVSPRDVYKSVSKAEDLAAKIQWYNRVWRFLPFVSYWGLFLAVSGDMNCCCPDNRQTVSGFRSMSSFQKSWFIVTKIIKFLLNALAIFIAVVAMRGAVQITVSKQKTHHVHSVYRTLNSGPVCAFDTKCGDIKTFENKNASDAANYTIAHCGECGGCSTWQDLSVQWNTRKNAAKLSQACGLKNMFNRDNMAKCLSEDMGWTTECAYAWVHSVECSKQNCMFVAIAAMITNKLGNFAVGPDSFTPANCNEAQCEQGNPGHFAKLSGASRRKMNIHSDIARPKDQQCSIIGAVPKDADGFNDWGPFFEELCPREASPP